MNKKIMLITVLTMYVTFALASPIVFAEENQSSGLFNSDIGFDVSTDLTAPIAPSQTKEVEITVKCKFDMNPLVKWFFLKRKIGRLIFLGPGYTSRLMYIIKGIPPITVNLIITDKPDWCTAKLDNEQLNFEINKKLLDNVIPDQTVKLTLTVDENATALDKGDIVISANSSREWGKILGKVLLTLPVATNETSISVQVAYKSDIIIESKSELTVPPLQNNTVPINITNIGNGKSIVSVQASIPENWNITFNKDEVILDVGKTEQIILTYMPPKDFSDQPISLAFTPKSTGGEYEGTPVTTSITFHNDGSLKEDGGADLSLILILISIIVIIIVIIVVILLLRRKKQ